MPFRTPKICGCGRKVPADQRCQCEARRQREYDARRPTARERGYDSKWRREGKAFLALPENQNCRCGCGRIADTVDHIIAHKGDQRLFWSRSNWQALNGHCHSRWKQRGERTFGIS
jgi:5-methylcytosine-specific restriction endonuclease McrA